MPLVKSSTSKASKTRILLVDDHALVRRGLASLIESERDLRVCGQAANHQDGLAAIITSKPDLVIADLALEDSDGLELIKDIKLLHPNLPVLALSMHDEAVYAERALRAGALGYITKQEIDDKVLNAIRRVLAGKTHLSAAMTRVFSEKFLGGGKCESDTGLEALSDRELQVFTKIGAGNSTRAIALALGLSVKTIESHRENIKTKLELLTGAAVNRSAILWAVSGRLV